MCNFNILRKQPQGLAIKTLHKKMVVSPLAVNNTFVALQGFETSQHTMSTQKERETMKSWLF